LIEPHWLIVYSSGGISGVDTDGESDGGGGVDGGDCCSESADPVLDLLSDLYSELNVFLCKG